jgi:hypothetical protein
MRAMNDGGVLGTGMVLAILQHFAGEVGQWFLFVLRRFFRRDLGIGAEGCRGMKTSVGGQCPGGDEVM